MDASASLAFPFPPALAGAVDEPRPSGETTPAVPTPSDRALLERVARGDRDAFTLLYRRYERPVFGVLLRLSGRRAVAEEWLQEAFTRVWLGAGTHDPTRGSVKPWIFTIALNTARSDLARKRSRTPHVSIEEAGLDLPDEDGAELSGRLDAAAQAAAVAEALARLPDYMREVVVLRCGRELSFAEIAEVTGAPVGTLKSRFHRAVLALRQSVGRREGRVR
jgi:RNA polymerase sigma-70 factor (ECF subfamily)